MAHKSVAFGDSMAVQTGNLPAFRKIPFGAELFVRDRYTGLAAIAGADQVRLSICIERELTQIGQHHAWTVDRTNHDRNRVEMKAVPPLARVLYA